LFFTDECSYRFRNEDRFDKTYLNAIDTTDSGTGEIINSNIRNNADHFKSCSIDEVEQMNLIGYEIVSSLSHPFYMGKKHQNFYYIHVSEF
jgi:ribosomal protein L31